MPKQPAQAEVVTLEPAEEMKLLRGLRDLVGERWGYFLGRRLKQSEMNEATKEERKAVNELRKKITGENLEELITNGDIASYQTCLKDIKTAREKVSKKAKPFRDKIAPLNKAQRYLDSVAIPDALKEVGTPVAPRFSLSSWIEKAIAAEKQKK